MLTRLDAPGDAELISAVRGGDVSAYGALFERHVDAARRLARQLVNPSDADDLVSDAFAKVLGVLQRGGGPDLAFRAYLLTAVRRLHVDRIRATSKLHTTGDMEAFDPGVPFRDTAVEGFENAAAAKAFASLPERWQLVLWHTEVEGQKPAEIAPLLGMSANSVSALAYRAREGLRQAFLNSHAEELDDAKCRWTHEHLGAYIRGGVSKRDSGKVEDHLDECRPCMGIYLELVEVNTNLGAILAPLLLGAAASGYLASTTAGVLKAGVLVGLLDRGKEFLAANTQAAAVAGVVAVTAVVGVSIAATTGGGGQPVAEPPAHAGAPATSEDESSAPAPGSPRSPTSSDQPSGPASQPLLPGQAPGSAVPGSETDAPSSTQEPASTTSRSGDPGSDGEQGSADGPRGQTSSPPDGSPGSSPDSSPGGPNPSTPPSSPPPSSPPPSTQPPSSPPPTTQPPSSPPPSYDLQVAMSAPVSRGQSGQYVVSVTVTGLEPGGAARLLIRATEGVVTDFMQIEGPCEKVLVLSLLELDCTIATTPQTVSFRVRAIQPATLTAIVSPGKGTQDVRDDNNRQSRSLAGLGNN